MKRIGEIRDGDQLYVKDWVYEALESLHEPEPPPPPPPPPEEGDRALESASVSSNSARGIYGWDVTARLESLTVTEGRITFPYTIFDGVAWPALDPDDPNPVVGNLWFMALLNGQWYAGTVDWLRPHQKDKTLDVPHEHANTAEALPTFCKVGPLGVYVPSRGDRCGMFVSSIARNGKTTVNERSNVILFDWPY